MGDKEEFWLLGPRRDWALKLKGQYAWGASSLNCLFLIELHGLPWFINVSESQGPGAVLYSFPINCTSYVPTLELLYVRPPTTFFNPPSLNRQQQTYTAMVGSWAQMGSMGGQGQALNSPSQR